MYKALVHSKIEYSQTWTHSRRITKLCERCFTAVDNCQWRATFFIDSASE